MGRHWGAAAVLAGVLAPTLASAQQSCGNGFRIDGTVSDASGAIIPGAQVQAGVGAQATTDAAGHYVLACVPTGVGTLTVDAAGFAAGTARVEGQAGGVAHIDLTLAVAQVQTNVQVSGDAGAMDTDRGDEATTLDTRQVQQMADDPDDFLRELQVLAAEAGGDPAAATIMVDGFQNASALPPKSSIASIRVSPDLFSAEYQWPPFSGGLIQIVTKPGADSFHGAVFFTDSDGIFNATDPFSVSPTPASKQRYGFELGGPVIPKKADFFVALEKRDINEFNVVNAVTLDVNENQTVLQQTVAAPQRLWIASARGDWQVTPEDMATLSFSFNVNNLGNQGVGGLTLAEAGYSQMVGEYGLRLSNTQTLSANVLHETRIGYTWKRTEQTPLSTTPSLEVSGYFTGGGATSQNLNDRERDLEADDDVMVTHGRHSLKIGAQSLGKFIHDYDPSTFNGAYVFGGGSAPALDANNNPTGQTTTISALEQYSRALLNLSGGSPTTYQQTSGTPLVPLTQWQLGVYVEDDIKLAPRFSVTTGLRYALQTTPGSFGNFDPRVGLSWSPDQKGTWVFHLRTGLFSDPTMAAYATEVARLNGSRQQETTVYSPSYSSPMTPVAGSIEVSTVNQFEKSLAQQSTFTAYFNAEHDFPKHWHVRGNLYWGEDWNSVRLRNMNAPMVASSVGIAPDPTAALLAPRPIAPDENILQYQNSGHLAGNVVSISVDQHSYKWFGLNARYGHMNFKTDTSNDLSTQSGYSDQGESARADWLKANGFSLLGNMALPYKVEVSTELDASSGLPYNITTGTDNNGDGDYNDRPAYASAPGPGVYSTRFGLLTTNTVNGDVPRNLGTMPGSIHLDMNVSRAFQVHGNKDHPQTLTFNARSANLLNHTNVTAVGTVLDSPNIGESIAAEAARRVELGARFSF